MTNNYTPMMQQYLQLRDEHQGALLLYRLGDFYELFFEDAKLVAPLLGLVLTKRGYHQDQPIPMCGVPAHALNFYLKKLIDQGLKVAICEQLDQQGNNQEKLPLVERKVVRVVTPGTVLEEDCLDATTNNYLAAVFIASEEQVALAYVDISTGSFILNSTTLPKLQTELSCLEPAELLVPKTVFLKQNKLLGDYFKQATQVDDSHFNSQRGASLVKKFFKVASLSSLGDFSEPQLAACGALLFYLELTQKNNLPLLSYPQFHNRDHLFIDLTTRRSLELTASFAGERRGSLLAVIDKTLTSGGRRLLKHLFAHPLRSADQINSQLDKVQFLANSDLLAPLRTTLKICPDLERALSRLLSKRGGPRDLALIGESLVSAQDLFLLSSRIDLHELQLVLAPCSGYEEIIVELQAALTDQLPLTVNDGNFIRYGYDAVLDEWRIYRDQAQQQLTLLQNKYILATGVNSLKIKHNNLLGYYVEVNSRYASKLGESFIHRQSMSNSVRYRTAELSELEKKIYQAQAEALAIEINLFNRFIAKLEAIHPKLAATAKALAQIDLYTSLATLAQNQNYCRPQVDNSQAFAITEGWHPVVGEVLPSDKQFIANHCQLEQASQLMLVTGPNMAGKSTYLRQNALIVFLAQIGCYVPAKTAHLGVVDRLFSRVGAVDDLAHGKSTFMVEMIETATILNQATEKSLVILDEVGRGTSTLDGLSIAWATVEHLHEVINCRGLLATHYQELTLLEKKLTKLSNFHLQIREWENEITFLYQVAAGSSPKAYGLHVASLAGVPRSVLRRAEAILASLEDSRQQLTPDLLALADNCIQDK